MDFIKWLALILAVPFLLVAGGLLLNRPPLLSPPWPVERLRTYLTTNVAETRVDHPYPELRSPRLRVDQETARTAVLDAMGELGWQDIHADEAEVRAAVISRLFRFRDDVTVRLEGAEDRTLLHARSASRIGKGDFAANARHLRDLFEALGRRGLIPEN